MPAAICGLMAQESGAAKPAAVPEADDDTMILRIWHGWTMPANADTYERVVQDEVFAMIAAKKVVFYGGIDLLRRRAGDEVERATIMRFDTLDAAKVFAGHDDGRSFVSLKAQALLKRFDEQAQYDDHSRHIHHADAGPTNA